MSFDPSKPYNALPLLPPRGPIETPTVLRKAVSASRALAELKGIGRTIPNQAMLINTLTLQEAGASSAIENIITTDDALFKAFSVGGEPEDPAVKEVLHYREAIWEGFQAVTKRPLLTTNLFISIVQTLKKNRAGIRNAPGTVLKNPNTGMVVYTLPEGEGLLREKLKNMEEYIHAKNGLDPLIKMAILHYQFEAIHPFFDGNGRTGRIINILYLIQQGLLDLPVLFLSRHIIRNKSEYYRLLFEVTRNEAWEPWLLYMLEAVEKTAILTKSRIEGIRDLMEAALRDAKAKLPKWIYSKELIELLFHQPYTKTRFLVEAGIAERKTAAEYLSALEKMGLLKRHKIGKENLFLNVPLFALLSK